MKDKIQHYVRNPYPIDLVPDEGGFLASIPDLPGCISSGESPQEALQGLDEAKELWIQGRVEAGLPIPEPTGPADYSGKFVLRVPRSLHRDLDTSARREGVSLNQYIVKLLAERMHLANIQASLERFSEKIARRLELQFADSTEDQQRRGSAWDRVMEGFRRARSRQQFSTEGDEAIRRHVRELILGSMYEVDVKKGSEEVIVALEHLPTPPKGKQEFSVKPFHTWENVHKK